MNKLFSTAIMLGLMGASIASYSQAQDPASAIGNIQRLSQAGNSKQAVEEADKLVKYFSNKKSRIAKQFSYLLPFVYWERANAKMALKQYLLAAADYDILATNADFKSKEMRDAAKRHPGKALDYSQYLTASLFQKGYCLFMAGDVSGKPEHFEASQKALQDYLELYRKGRVSDVERKSQLEGKVCFMLMQTCLRQATPDFIKANEYLELSRKSRSKLPNDMVMGALKSVVEVAEKNPEQIGWIYKTINSNPESFNLPILSGALYGGQFVNHANKVGAVAREAMGKGEAKVAQEAALSALALYSLIPDTDAVISSLDEQLKYIGSSKLAAIPDRTASVTYNIATQKQLQTAYKKSLADNQPFEAFGLLGSNTIWIKLGSSRLGKAGYQVLTDLYPNLSTRDGEGKLNSMKNQNLMQLAGLARSIGDTEHAIKIEKALEGADLGGDSRNKLLVNKLARLVGDRDWENAIAAADELLEIYKADKKNQYYITAAFCKLAALYSLQRFEELTAPSEEFLKLEGLTGETAEKYKPQALFFLADSYNRLASLDAKNLDKAYTTAQAFMGEFGNTDLEKYNGLAPNIYYSAIDTLLKRQGHGDEEKQKQDLAKALDYCRFVAEHWKSHELYPITQLLSGNILIKSEVPKEQLEGTRALEGSVDEGVKLNTAQSREIASNALYSLCALSADLLLPGETEEKHAKRLSEYSARFWKELDAAGNPFSLKLGIMELQNSLKQKDKAVFDAAYKHMQDILKRESAQIAKTGKHDMEYEATFYDTATQYFDGMQKFGAEIKPEQKVAYFEGIQGVDPGDKFTQSLVQISLVEALQEVLQTVTDATERSKMNNRITDIYRGLARDYKPSELSDYVAVQLGNFLVGYVKELPEARQDDRAKAIALFDKVAQNPDSESYYKGILGKAEASALAKDEAERKNSVQLFSQLVESGDPEVMQNALMGLSKAYMAEGNYAEALVTAGRFMQLRPKPKGTTMLDMQMLMGEAFTKNNEIDKAAIQYLNIFGGDAGRISYSAPAILAYMELIWNRNKPSSGDRLQGNFKPSDRFVAWSTGSNFLERLKRTTGLMDKVTPDDRDLINRVQSAVDKYKNDPAVVSESRENLRFTQQTQGN